MKHHILAGCILALGIAPAAAADMATKAPLSAPMARSVYDWTGLYLGVNAGYGQSHNCWDMQGAFVVSFTPPLAEGCNNATGAVAGGQIGYRYQVNSFVFGIEAQGDWANLKGSNRSAIFNGINAQIAPFAINLTNTTKVDAIGMFTGQAGYSFGPVLWYVKGGAAVTDNSYNGSLSITGPGVPARFNPLLTDSAKEIKFGGVVGTGLDFMFAQGWSVGVEYNHLFMGSRNVGFALTNPPLATIGGIGLLGNGSPSRNDRISQDIDMATVRLNYSFGGH